MKISGNPSDYCLELHHNLYGQKQAVKVWHDYLLKKLKGIGFKKSEHEPCFLYRGECIYVLYIDDALLFGTSKSVTDKVITNLCKTNSRWDNFRLLSRERQGER